jgi:hypothetical protein
MDVGVLVRTLVFDEVINIDTNFTRLCFSVVYSHHDTGGIDIVNHTTT